MNDVPFYKTKMGRQFYDRTMPTLVKEIERLTEVLRCVVESATTEAAPSGDGADD